ncbi:twin-arginine translocation signal domain-containing protein [Nocardioides sp. REDSEA-S30_B4]|uniref:twin-arginine translocation signal domain-containing protein n=1 Tax=Nocardioides sp. REDSEA-S30_B4 TaxID=1811552 RepID=UPI000A77DAD5
MGHGPHRPYVSRRQFVQRTAAVGIAAGAGPFLVSSHSEGRQERWVKRTLRRQGPRRRLHHRADAPGGVLLRPARQRPGRAEGVVPAVRQVRRRPGDPGATTTTTNAPT